MEKFFELQQFDLEAQLETQGHQVLETVGNPMRKVSQAYLNTDGQLETRNSMFMSRISPKVLEAYDNLPSMIIEESKHDEDANSDSPQRISSSPLILQGLDSAAD